MPPLPPPITQTWARMRSWGSEPAPAVATELQRIRAPPVAVASMALAAVRRVIFTNRVLDDVVNCCPGIPNEHTRGAGGIQARSARESRGRADRKMGRQKDGASRPSVEIASDPLTVMYRLSMINA